VSERMTFVMDYLIIGALTSSLPAWLATPGARRFQQAIRELDQVVFQIIAEERCATTPSDSMLAMLLHMVDADTGERMTDAQLHDEVMTFFVAGYETTSLALTWAVDFLTHEPAVMTRVQHEIDNVLGGRLPTFADLAGLSYTKMVLQESMRLCSPSWLLPRTAIADDEIDGFAIPAGTTVVSLTYGIHHNSSVWEDPERFDPERFSDERMAQQHKLAWMPFGAGQRQCIGRDFAIMEAQIILAILMQRYTLAGVAAQLARPKLSATFKPKGAVLVNLRPRGIT